MAFRYVRLLPVVGEVTQISTGAFPLRDRIGVTQQSRDATPSSAPLTNREFKALDATIDAVRNTVELIIKEVAVIVGNVHMYAIDEFINILRKACEVNRLNRRSIAV